ncbi:zinc finger protein 791-like isoform X2 [Anthonomus grandis grandis]|uniref:zinc finger protein 791-like isoform X2 n=1 Tax=Anthonomus grandis grandis TaxID=2921223 RepID=UPI002165AA27|nr:zinc finger protein 791-like isoform X2 [Anthonomus grandis grandis]
MDQEQDDTVTVKEEDNVDPTVLYSCEACDITFTCVEEHLAEFHEDEEVILETEEPESVDQEDDNEEEITENNGEDPHNSIGNSISHEENALQEPKPVLTKYVVNFGEAREISEEEACNLDKTVKVLEILSCSNCKLQFPNITHFNKHICSNISEFTKKNTAKLLEKHSCPNCSLQFSNITQLREHNCWNIEYENKVNTSNKQSKSITKKKKKTKKPVVEENKTVEVQKSKPNVPCRYQCALCMVDYASKSELKEHMKSHLIYDSSGLVSKSIITMSLHPCNICDIKFPTYKEMQLHEKMHLQQELELTYSTGGKQNNEKQTIRETFNCDICNKVYDKNYEEIHMKSHLDGIDNLCLICNKRFEPRENLEMHVKAHSKSSKLLCSYCKKTFPRYELLKQHVETQCQKRDFECSFCGRRFAKPTDKAIHERIHTGVKPHVCEVCGKSFRISYCLTLHMRTHTGNRPYACTFMACNKRFKSLSMLTNHQKTHSDVRNYKCPYCPKAFKTIVQLAGHKNSHTKPFSCKECNRPFSSLYAVRAHMETHKRNNNLKFECWICGASYARSFALKDHLNEAHPQETNTETQDLQAVMQLDASTEEIQNPENVEEAMNQREEIQTVHIAEQTNVEEQGEYEIAEDEVGICNVQVITSEDSVLYVDETPKTNAMVAVEAEVKAEP